MREELLARVWEHLSGRVDGPLGFRFLLQPAAAAILAVRAGLRDAANDRPAFLWAALAGTVRRADLAREAVKDIGAVWMFACVLDTIFQVVEFGRVYPGETLLVASLLAVLPYAVIRGPVQRLAQRPRLR
jgi:hypothetical protein